MNEVQDINRIVENFNQLSILIIGDVMIDSYLIGKSTRISPEAPVPIVNCDTRENRLGGAANVALNIHAMGATPLLCSIVGEDTMGATFLTLMSEEKHLSTEGILQSAERITTVKSRIISHGQQLLRVDSESTQTLSSTLEAQFIEHILSILKKKKIDAIIFEDYDKGNITVNLIETITAWALAKKIPTLADPKKRNFLSYKNLTLFKPNLKEFYEGIGEEYSTIDLSVLKHRCSEFKKKQKIEMLMVTLSEKGIFVSGEKDIHFPTQVRAVTDVSGAGDTVISLASLCLASQVDMETTLKLSNLAGGQVCEKSGVVPVNKEDLIERFKELYEKKY